MLAVPSSFKQTVAFVRDIYQTQDFIPLHAPRFKGNEARYVLDCLESTFVSSVGQYVNDFEKRVCAYTGAPYAIATVNGTAALHLALLLANVRPGDLVITQPLTFVATANAIAYTGATPVFLDVDQDTLGLSPEALQDFLQAHCQLDDAGHCIHQSTGKRVVACVPMHTFGHAARIETIAQLCTAHRIALVEDAAEAMGSRKNDTHLGTFGPLGTLSFNGNKIITCGGGGMILTHDEALAQRAKHLTTQAKVPHPWEYVHDAIGYNYRLPNLNAALACAQMEELDDFVTAKRALAVQYSDFFAAPDRPTFVTEPEGSCSNYWLNAVLLDDLAERDLFLQYTNDQGVMTRPAWRLIHRLPLFPDAIVQPLPNAEWLEARLVNLPSSVPDR
ncbi:aminotransferase, LLPSF_NHT_00031 family [Catalinimonas alkaloidigena]|uniref:Aminotransferase, LLPSF_NHT_00031 family n=1 Tax=Catalinimonas alkaloidigena TaxID=1075417 RepID=A0A1G8ZKC3_9BACT|nr:LegC family aminotransferase [Catalinimonas alkaloidigena]SDK15481.1 aminotransferase, LLPSF_NHT_00031 family [Catalinimonas alkaloidigena]